ncbi:chitosanase [Shewanella sp. JM162201]|uniref:Chitosanase n=1 Tax=Shewanella jiangmenensis TaxID=2837387 RepID=A0ABS5V4T4_9GAMM|nr:chitosanase [Shewanella jiangmenensis]MBT1445477.1 chitosanase [Shewanella jiangmenensis]
MDIPKDFIIRIINQFETGSPEGAYDKLVIQDDGINGTYQITYGRSQTTEQGNLRYLLEMYVEAQGAYSTDLLPFLDRIGQESLVAENEFHELLVRAAKDDPVMRQVQDKFFDAFYWEPAIEWCEEYGLKTALAGLVVYDSQVHSGGVPLFLRKRFSERPPSKGGDEKRWLAAYVDARHQWLRYHKRTQLRECVSRTECFRQEMERGNWDLQLRPVMVKGVAIE